MSAIPKLFGLSIWVWIAILFVVFLLAIFKVTPTNEETQEPPP